MERRDRCPVPGGRPRRIRHRFGTRRRPATGPRPGRPEPAQPPSEAASKPGPAPQLAGGPARTRPTRDTWHVRTVCRCCSGKPSADWLVMWGSSMVQQWSSSRPRPPLRRKRLLCSPNLPCPSRSIWPKRPCASPPPCPSTGAAPRPHTGPRCCSAANGSTPGLRPREPADTRRPPPRIRYRPATGSGAHRRGRAGRYSVGAVADSVIRRRGEPAHRGTQKQDDEERTRCSGAHVRCGGGAAAGRR